MKKKLEKIKNKKGITLIALVITIIVIMILVGITISALTGQDLIISATQNASEKYNEAASTEVQDVDNALDKLKNALAQNENENPNLTITVEQWNALNDKFTDLSNKYTVLEEELAELKNGSSSSGALSMYPVGSIYISISSINPGELFGGTWEAYGAGRTLIGVGTGTDENSTEREFTANETGGEYTHQLTVDEMPSHSHTVKGAWNKYSGNDGRLSLLDNGSVQKQTESAGGNEFHNNIQPYITAYMWKRVS